MGESFLWRVESLDLPRLGERLEEALLADEEEEERSRLLRFRDPISLL